MLRMSELSQTSQPHAPVATHDAEASMIRATVQHGAEPPTSLGVDSRKLGMWTFIGSETLFFAALITTYLINARINAGRPDFQNPKEYLGIVFTSMLAAILLASSLTMVLSLSALRRNRMGQFRVWLLATAGLGLCFIGGQVIEFTRLYSEHVTLQSSMFGTSFFVLTGFHGTHVGLGVVWLLSVFARSLRGRYSSKNDMDVEMVGLYWHFVDLVWVGIFTLIYLI